MKRLILGVLSAVLLSGVVLPTARSQEHEGYQTQPFNLVYLGYQGFFEGDGIPSSASFVSAIRSRRVTAEDLVRAGIEQGRLTPDTIEDEEYLNGVENHLEDFIRDN